MSITVGLGCQLDDLTQRGKEAIKSADFVILRTAKTQSSKTLEKTTKYISLDYLYEQADNFDSLNKAIVDVVIDYAKKGNVAYCVDGSGLDDESVKILAKNGDMTIIAGVSREVNALAAANYTASSITSISAVDFATEKAFFAPYNTLVIKELDDKYIASDVKLKILELYGNIELYYVNTESSTIIEAKDLDMQVEYNYYTSIVIADKKYMDKERFCFGDLMSIVYKLRAKDGCKWDREQTHDSIKINAIEEAYELLEAIELKDTDKMIEESGDVLLQGIFHAIIAEDTGEFSITDVLSVLSKKLLNRHTHIFGEDKANTEEEALQAWESAKVKEKNQRSYTQRMQQVASNLPALIRSNKVQKIARKANFDWESEEGAFSKLEEEINELKNALPNERQEEGGDLLFAAVNVLRHLKIEPELALTAATNKFLTRFEKVEQRVNDKNKKMNECTLEELDKIYMEIKDENW